VLAEKSIQTTADLEGRLTHAFRRIVGRTPTAYDIDALKRMHARQLEIYRTDVDAAKQLLAVGESSHDTSLDPAGHAAMTSVCLAIFNLDEALTRE
jgi:hypothetical protein